MESRVEVLTALLNAVADGRVTPERALELARSQDTSSVLTEVAPSGGATLFEVSPTASPRKPTEKLPAARPARTTDAAPVDGAPIDGRYNVLREFARGGMGRVLLALDTTVGREIAIKEILPATGGSGRHPATDTTVANVERFLREARVTGQLEHPNIVPVYEIGTREDGSVYYTMKFVRGETLAERLRKLEGMQQRLGLLDAFAQVCNALAFAHSRGVVHRDLKPSNIMLGEFGEVLVLDWGLAKLRGVEDIEGGRTISDGSTVKTMDGLIMGTPAYMAPEQARAEEVDELSDVYSLGAILQEIITGKPAYQGSSPQQIVTRVLTEPPAPLPEDAPPELAALVKHAMHRDRAQRLQGARKLADEVKAYRDGRALTVYRYSTGEVLKRFVARHKAAVVVAATLLLALAALAGWSAYSIITEQQRTSAERDRAVAASEQADRNAASARRFADESRRNADEATRQAELAGKRRAEAEENLRKAEVSLGLAYTQAAQMAMQELRVNEAALFAARALTHQETPAARAVIAQCAVYPCTAVHDLAGRTAHCLALSRDGRWLAIGDGNNIRVLDRASEEPATVVEGSSDIWALDYGADGLLAALDNSGLLRVLDTQGEALAAAELAGSGWSVHFSPDRARVAAGMRDGTAWVLDLADGEGVQLQGAEGAVDVRFSPDGALLAMATGHELRLIDSHALEVTRTITAATQLLRARFSPLGDEVYACGNEGALYAWRVADGELLWQTSTGSGAATSLGVNAEGRIAVGGQRTQVLLLSRDGTIEARISPGVEWLTGVVLGADYMLASGGGVREWSLAPRYGVRRIDLPDEPMEIDFSPDGGTLAVSLRDGCIGLLAWPEGELARAVRGPSGWAGGLTHLPDGALVATCDGVLHHWHHGKRTRHELHGDSGAIAVSPDNGMVAMVHGSGVQVRNAELGVVRNIATDAKAYCLAFGPGVLAVGCVDGCVELYRTGDWSRSTRFRAYEQRVLTVTWVGDRLVCTGSTADVAIFNVEGQLISRLQTGSSGLLFAAAALQATTRVAVGDGAGFVTLLDVQDPALLCRFRATPEFVTSIRFSRDGRHMVAASVSGGLSVLDVQYLYQPAAELEAQLQDALSMTIEDMAPRFLPRAATQRPDVKRVSAGYIRELAPYVADGRVNCQLWWQEQGLPGLVAARARDEARRSFKRGVALLAEGRPARALPHLERAAEVIGDAPALLALGRCLGLCERVPEALETLARAKQAPATPTFHHGELWAELAQWRHHQGLHDAAWKAVLQALENDYIPDEDDVALWAEIERAARDQTG
ncbi:MAG: protein kinase [Planctomycetes bacterium]|nr:protein kinase [Planctomycetota bacterium]MCW8135245.1 protein kinase [Planctomycetota bacterium]